MAKGNKKVNELGKNTQFCGESAVEAQKKSVQAHYAKKERERIFREDLIKALGDKDWNDIIGNAILRSKDNKADLELLLAVIGQKPIDKQQVDVRATSTFEDAIDELIGRKA